MSSSTNTSLTDDINTTPLYIQTSSFTSPSTTSRSDVPISSSTQRTLLMTTTLAPVWVIGLAIVIAVLCVGLNLGLLSAFFCFRRRNAQKQRAQISANKGPRLHAYNPTI